ncbi:MAG: Asp-tRNA(Asn)/Glu-tRNA(Gln) amidotransferase subunit GatC [Candidatus Omnitrophota bacterium]
MSKGKKALKIDIEYTANLTRVALSAKEVSTFGGQLDTILGYINKLNEVDTEGVEPTSHVLSLKNVLREDEVRPSLSAEDALKNAPDQHKGSFKVPKIIED